MSEPGDRHYRIIAFSTDPAFDELELKYDPYLEIHQIDSLFDTFKIESIDPDASVMTYKFSWHTGYDLPIEIRRDISALYSKHFED